MRVDFYHLQKQVLEDVLPKLLEKAYASGKKEAGFELSVAYKPMAELIRNLSVDFVKSHPDVDSVFFSANCPTASLKNPFLGHEFAHYHIDYYME